MLQAELSGEAYSKADHNRELRPKLNNRSKSSVEYQHQNISVDLIGMGLPYIDGYKPAKHIQKTLVQAVGEYLVRHPGFFEKLLAGPVLNPTLVVAELMTSGPEFALIPESLDG